MYEYTSPVDICYWSGIQCFLIIVFSVINSGLEDQVDAKDDEDIDAEEDNQP